MPHRSLWFWLAVTGISAAAGALFSALIDAAAPIGIAFGICIGLAVIAYESRLVLPKLHRWVREQATPVFVLLSLGIYVALILAGNTVAGAALWAAGLLTGTFVEAVTPPRGSIVYSLVVSSGVAFVLRIRDLIGAELFNALLLGRYHRPVSEERVFLFIDLVGSTSFADRHGDYRAQEFLGEFFALLAGPVRRYRGSIDDYIGDMALVSWPLGRGVADAACLRCVLALEEVLALKAEPLRRRFGEAPAFRAALHAGTVVTAEVGLDRHKIAYFGDAVNTTARLEALSKQLGVAVIASADLLARIGPLPEGVRADPLGAKAIRGRSEPLDCAALVRADLALSRAA